MISSPYKISAKATVKSRAVKLTLIAYFVPITSCVALLNLHVFFSYPSFQNELWLLLFVFSLPMFLIGLLFLIQGNIATTTKGNGVKADCFFTKPTYQVFFILSLVYVVFMSYRYLVIGSVLTEGITGARYNEISAGPGQGGIITGITALTSGAPIFLLLAQIERSGQERPTSYFALLLALTGLLSTFLTGGRNSLLINVVFLFMASQIWPTLSIRRALKGPSIKRFFFRIIVYSTAFFSLALSLYIFVERGRLRSDDLIYRATLLASESNFFFDPANVPLWMPQEIYFALASVHNYFTIGLVYFDRLLILGLHNGHLGGTYNFFLFFLIIDKILGTTLSANIKTDLPFIGAYYSLSGSIYVDFGYVGLILGALAMPFLSILFISGALKGNRRLLPIAALSLTVLAMSPLYNASAVGSGPSLLAISVVFYLVGRRRYRRFTRLKTPPAHLHARPEGNRTRSVQNLRQGRTNSEHHAAQRIRPGS